MYTVIRTSGYQGDFWHYVTQFRKRKNAVAHAKKMESPNNATSENYVVAVIGDIRSDGYDFRGDTRRAGMREKHLNSRNCFIQEN